MATDQVKHSRSWRHAFDTCSIFVLQWKQIQQSKCIIFIYWVKRERTLIDTNIQNKNSDEKMSSTLNQAFVITNAQIDARSIFICMLFCINASLQYFPVCYLQCNRSPCKNVSESFAVFSPLCGDEENQLKKNILENSFEAHLSLGKCNCLPLFVNAKLSLSFSRTVEHCNFISFF